MRDNSGFMHHTARLLVASTAVALLLLGCNAESKAKARVALRTAKLAAEFDSSSVEAKDVVHYHADGFSIDIPAGFSYAQMKAPTLLMAVRRGDAASTMNVLRHSVETSNPERFVRSMLANMKKLNDTYEFEPLAVEETQMRVRYYVTHAGNPQRGVMVLIPRSGALWQLMVTGPRATEDAKLDAIAQTWRLD